MLLIHIAGRCYASNFDILISFLLIVFVLFVLLFKCYKCHDKLPFLSSLLLIIQSAKQRIPTKDMYLMEGVLRNVTERAKLFGDE